MIEVRADGIRGSRITIHAAGKERTREPVSMMPPPYLTLAPEKSVVFLISENKPVFASNFLQGHLPTYITEADERCWKPCNQEDAWIMLDLEGEQEIREIHLWVVAETQAESLEIEISGNGKDFWPMELVYDESFYRLMKTATCRFIRIKVAGAVKGVREIRVFS